MTKTERLQHYRQIENLLEKIAHNAFLLRERAHDEAYEDLLDDEYRRARQDAEDEEYQRQEEAYLKQRLLDEEERDQELEVDEYRRARLEAEEENERRDDEARYQAACHEEEWSDENVEPSQEELMEAAEVVKRIDEDWEGEIIYLMRLHSDGRFKIGAVTHKQRLAKRLSEARTWVPDAQYVTVWKGRWAWETAARQIISSDEAVCAAAMKLLFDPTKAPSGPGSEVIEGATEADLVERGDELFSRYLYPLLEKEDNA